MPVIPILKGVVTVTGASKETEEAIYTKTVNAYGETVGELLDNIVKAAATIAGDLFQWSVMQRPEGYKLSDDMWLMTSHHPDVFDVAAASPVIMETPNGANFDSMENLVRSAVIIRNVTCFMGIAKLKQAGAVDMDAPLDDGKDVNLMGKDISFEEMGTYGFTGAHMDAILRNSMLAGRLPATIFNQPQNENLP